MDEACANAIEHAYGHDRTKEVKVRIAFTEDEMRVAVIDTGQSFDPTGVKPLEVEELVAKRRTGGLGIRLIKTLMDQVLYDLEPGKKNELHMVKRISKKE